MSTLSRSVCSGRLALIPIVFIFTLITACSTVNCDPEMVYRSEKNDREKGCDAEPCPPLAPKVGPGSGTFPHASVRKTDFEDPENSAYHSYIYEPMDPVPISAPVVLFLHGYFDAKPKAYEAMLNHIARKGFIVIYPTYGNFLGPKDWTENAAESLKRSLVFLKSQNHILPDLNKVAYVGHSIGGILALHLAQKNAESPEKGLPEPKLIITMEGAGIASPAYPFLSIEDLSKIPNSTNLLMIMAEDSYQNRLKETDHCENLSAKPTSNCNGFAVNLRAYRNTTQIPTNMKTAVMIPNDIRGKSALRSEHNGAQGYCGFNSKPIDAIDTWGYWRYTVGALEQVFEHQPPEFSSLAEARNRTAGVWSDGKPAKPAISLDTCLEKGQCPIL